MFDKITMQVPLENQNLELIIKTNQLIEIVKNGAYFYEHQNIGLVKSIYPTSSHGLVTAEVDLLEKLPFPVGTSIGIDVLTDEMQGCILPSDTILHKKEGTFVMVYNGESFTPVKVKVRIEANGQVIVDPCPKALVARGSEVKLSKLQAYDKVNVLGEKDAK